MKISRQVLDRKNQLLQGMDQKYWEWRDHYRELSEFILPHRYVWLEGQHSQDMGARRYRTRRIVNNTGTLAAKQLAAGMMGGITSPAHQWFRLNEEGRDPQEVENQQIRAYLDHVQAMMLQVFAGSNFYSTIQTTYLDLGVFGTSAVVVYEHEENVIDCYLSPVGEYRIAQNASREVTVFGRNIMMTVMQMVDKFGVGNCSQQVRTLYTNGGQGLLHQIPVCHLIEPNVQGEGALGKSFAYRECYWEKGAKDEVLSLTGFEEKPFFVPRWEVIGQDTYGQCPGMDALADIIQLQQETIRKAQGLDKMVNPPIVADSSVRRTPSLIPGGVTYAPSSSTVGAKALYQPNLPIGELSQDLAQLEYRIRETFYNDLFKMISQLATVRSATEIDARMQEKLILLGPVLQSFTKEVLDPVVTRLAAILQRRGMIQPPPTQLQGIEIRYSGILHEAQKAATIGSLERFIQVIGSMISVWPQAGYVLDPNKAIRAYGDQLNVPAVVMRSADDVDRIVQEMEERQRQEQALAQGKELTEAAKNLQGVEAGGGASVLQQLLGGAR